MPIPAPQHTVTRWTRSPAAAGQSLVTLHLQPTETTAFSRTRPGQYVVVDTPAGTGFFALCNLPAEAPQLLVKVQPDGPAEWLASIPEGAALSVSAPQGPGFPLSGVGPGVPVLVLATGSGIAPVRPLLAALNAGGVTPTLRYGARSADALAFLPHLQDLAQRGSARVQLFVSAGPPGPHAVAGHVTDGLEQALERPAESVVFLCGVPGMVADATDRLLKRGVPESQLRQNV